MNRIDRIDSVFRAIELERDYQDKKWGTIEQSPHTVLEWITIMQGEVLEALHAFNSSNKEDAPLPEILQAVAVGVACLEQYAETYGVPKGHEDGPHDI